MADDARNPFDDVGGEVASATPAPTAVLAAAPGAPAAAAPATPAIPAPVTAESNPFDAIGPAEVAPYRAPNSGLIAGARAAALGALPAAAGLAAAGPGAAGGAAIGAFGGPLAPITVPLGGIIGGVGAMMLAGKAVEKAQDYGISKLPESWQEAGGLDEASRHADEDQHPTASFIGGLVPYAVTMAPGGFGRAVLPENATAIQRLMANPYTSRLFGGAVQGGMELGQEKVEGEPANWQHVAIATAFGTVFNRPNRLGERLHSLGGELFRPVATPEAAPGVDAVAGQEPAPTIAQAADLKVMGPGITEDVFRGLQEQHLDAAMSAQETARQEAAVMGEPVPGPDLHDVARRMDPETFERYDELSRQRDAFRATIAESVNPSEDTIADAAAKRDAIQAQLDKIPTTGAGSDKAELRRLRAQVRDAQRGVDAVQARRDAYASGNAVDSPEVAQARAHLQAVDYEMRDLSPAVAAAYRRAADHAASETVPPAALPAEPEAVAPGPSAMVQALADRGEAAPAQEGGQVTGAPPTEISPGLTVDTKARTDSPGAPVPGLDIAADIARQLIAAGRPEIQARAEGEVLAARYRTRAARMGGALGTPEDLYRATAPTLVGPDGRRIPGPPRRPADPMAAPRVPDPPPPTPGAAEAPEAGALALAPRPPRAPRAHASLLEFLAQSGGIAPSGETQALFDRRSPFLPGIGALVRKGGMSLDKAMRAAEEAGYLHDPGLAAGAGPRTLGPNDLLDAMAREHGGTKIYRPGDEPPARRPTRAELRDATERYVVNELRGDGIDAADLDKPTLDAVVDRVHKGGESDAHHAYEREVIQQSEQNEHVRDERHLDTGDIPGWDVPADAIPASAASGSVARRAGETAQANGGSGEAGAAPRTAGGLDREAAERASRLEHERWLDSLNDRTLFQAQGDPFAALMAAIDGLNVEHDPAMLAARPMSETGIVDPHAAMWRLYHGTGTPEHFDRFDPKVEGSRTSGAERGALFTSPRPDEADTYAESRHDASFDAAGARIFPLNVKPGNTAVYDVGRLLAERDPRFMAASRAEYMYDAAKFDPEGQEWHDETFQNAIKRYDDDIKYHNELKERLGPDHGLSEYPTMSNLLYPQAAVIRMAREDGRDTAIIRGLGESSGGDQVVVLKPGFATSAIDPEHLFYQGANGGPRGSITFRPGQRNILRLTQNANASTFMHESGHQFLEEMLSDAAHPAAPEDVRADAQTVRDWLGNDGGPLKRRQHEKFATGFEQYLREGRAPSPELAGVFRQFRDWLVDLYRNLRGLGAPINDDIRGVFDRLLSTEPNRTVIAPERDGGPTIGDIHTADAAEVEPNEAAGAADRTDAEAARALNDAHPEHLSEIEAERNRIAAARQAERQQQGAGSAGTQPSGQAGEVAGGRGGLGGDRGEPNPVTRGGSAGASADAERQGGGRDAAEGDGLRGGERDQSAAAGSDGAGRDAASRGLAPRPAPWIGPDQPRLVDKAGNIRVENLTTREDVAQAIHEAAAANGDFIGQRRGVVTDGQVLDLADALGMTAESLNRRQIGQAFNAEQIVAARKLLIESATTVADLMKRAAVGTDEDVMAYAEARDRHQMIQAQVAGITAEAGRALRAFRDLSMSGEAKQADLFLRQATGKTLRQLKEEAALGAKFNTYFQVSKFLKDAQKPSFGRMLNEYFVNNLISGPVTHVTYGIGNTLLTSWKMMAEQPTAAAVGALRRAIGGGQDGVRIGEVLGQLQGAKTGVAPAVQAMLDAYRTGATSLLPGEAGQPQLPFQWNEHATPAELDEHATTFSIIKGLRDGIMTAGAMARDAGSDLLTGARGGPTMGLHYDPTGAIPDVQMRGVTVLPLGTVARFPSRNVAAIHSFFRSMNYSIDKAGQAYRIAANEGLKGQDFASRVADVITNPDDKVMERARSTSTDLTLMGQGGQFMNNLSKWLSTEVNLPGLGVTQPLRFVDPFVKIAGNVMNQSLLQRTPIGAFVSGEMRADLTGKNGPAAQDLATGRMLVGTALSVTFGTLAAQGVLTGSGPVGKDAEETRNIQAMWRLAGNQAHSVRIGDTWYDLHRLGPLGMLMGVAADLHDVAHLASDGDLTAAASALQQAIAQNVLDESFMKGPADLMKAIDEPGRYGEGYVKNFLTSFVPYSVAMAQMDRASDPYSRQARTVMDGIKAKIPGLSEELFPKRDIWGMPMANRGAAISPYVTAMYAQKADADPLAKEMLAIGVHPAAVERKIRGVELTDAQYDDYARIAGVTTRQRLEAMVRLPDWSRLPDHVRADIATAQIKGSREAAMGLMMAKYPSIPSTAAAARTAKAIGAPKPTGQVGAGS